MPTTQDMHVHAAGGVQRVQIPRDVCPRRAQRAHQASEMLNEGTRKLVACQSWASVLMQAPKAVCLSGVLAPWPAKLEGES